MCESWLAEKLKIEQRITQGSPQPTELPTVLPLSQIRTSPEVFQHRSGYQGPSHAHKAELVKSLKNSKGRPFDPITVFWIGDAWVLIDGHHRYEAYRDTQHKDPVPVKVFQGSLDEAIGEALKGNAKNKLAMGSGEKSNAAWRLVVGTQLSIRKTMEASTRSKPIVTQMRKVRNALRERNPESDLGNLTWAEALRMYRHLDEHPRDFDEDWMEKEAQALANTLVKTFGNRLGKQPQILWKALEIYDSRLIDRFLDDLGIDPETGEAVPEEELEF